MYFRQKKYVLEILELTRLFSILTFYQKYLKKLILKLLKITIFRFFWQSFMLRSVLDFYPIMIAQDAKLPYNETFSVLFFCQLSHGKKSFSDLSGLQYYYIYRFFLTLLCFQYYYYIPRIKKNGAFIVQKTC